MLISYFILEGGGSNDQWRPFNVYKISPENDHGRWWSLVAEPPIVFLNIIPVFALNDTRNNNRNVRQNSIERFHSL